MATYTCSLDGSPAAACASPAAYTDLTEGTHMFEATGTDAEVHVPFGPPAGHDMVYAVPPACIVRELLVQSNAVPPLLVRVIICDELELPCVVAANESVDGASVAFGCAAIPVPAREMFCGELGASSLMVIDAVRDPAPSGVNVTLIVQVAFGASAPLQVLVMLKSEGFDPPRSTDAMCSVAEPALVSVIV